MRVAVTAASGRLGHAVLRYLATLHPADEIVGVARDLAKLWMSGIDRREGDYASQASMTAALAGVDTVVMISAPIVSGVDRIPLHRNVIGAARAAGVRRLIFTGVAGNPDGPVTYFTPTQRVNWQAEADLRDSGLEWTVTRNGLYLELDLQHIVAAGRDGHVYRNPAGDGRAPYITIDELGYATARVAVTPGHGGRTYNLTGECMTQAELVALAADVFGINVRYEPNSDEESIARFTALMPQRGPEVARMLTGCFQFMRGSGFDVPSHYELAAGRPLRSVRQMLEDCRGRQ